MLDIRKLKYFISIVNESGYTAAGRKLFVSQPSLSKAIRNLEEEIGSKLFVSNRKQLELTEYGRSLYELSIPVVENFEEFTSRVKEETFMTTGNLSIGIPPIIGTCALSPILKAFLSHYPEVSLQICQRPANTIQKLVRDKNLDVGFVVLPLLPNEFNVVNIVKDKNVLVLPTNHPLANKNSITIEQIKYERFIVLDNEYTLNSSFISACHECDFEPNIVLELSHWDLIIQLIKAQAGISILPRRLFDYFSITGIKCIELSHYLSRWDVVMITKKNHYNNFIISTFLTFIREFIKNA